MNQKKSSDEKLRISNRLWKYRKEMGYSQKQVAKLLGYKDQTKICTWEKGEHLPNLQNLFKLSILYRKPVEFLYPNHYQLIREELRNNELN